MRRMSKQAIGVFSLAYPPFIGGAEIALKEIISRAPASDFVVFTKKFDRSWPTAESFDNCSILRIGRGKNSPRSYYGGLFGKILYIFQAVRVAEKIHRGRPFSAIWAVMASYAGIAALIFKLRHPSVPLLLTLQEGDSEEHILGKVGIFYPLWKKIFKKADYIQVISNFLADFARRHGARCPIEVIPNGVDLANYRTDKSYRTNKSHIIITTSRLVYKNGVDILIRSLPLLHTASYKLLILGDGPERQKLELLTKDLGIGDQVQFLGHIEPDQIPSYLLRSTVFARASRSEGLGNSFLEAMAIGLPIIGTNVGGIPDFLKDGETGLFAKVDDPGDLAEKLDRLSGDRNLREKLIANGKKLIAEKYTWDIVAAKMRNIFQKLCES